MNLNDLKKSSTTGAKTVVPIVGIGTTSPSDKLFIHGTGAAYTGWGQTIWNNLDTGMARTAHTTDGTGAQLWTGSMGSVNAHGFVNVKSNHPLVFSTYDAERMRITNTGNVGIGSTNPGYKLDVVGDINASGNVRGSGVVLSSDRRFKRNVQALDDSLAKILRLRGVRYQWRTEEFPNRHFDSRDQLGVIAQEVEEEFPELVNTASDGYKGVNYPALVAPLIESTKELYGMCRAAGDEVAELKRELASVKDRALQAETKADQAVRENAELKARLDRIEKLLQSK